MKNYREQEYEKHTLVDLFWECTLTCNAKYKQFRNKNRTKCSSCEKCENKEQF